MRLFLENLSFGIAMFIVTATTVAFVQHGRFIAIIKREDIYKNVLFIYCNWTSVDVYMTREQ